MTNAYYNHTTFPATSSAGSSALARAEFDAITAGFALLPTLAGNAGKTIVVDPTGSFLMAGASAGIAGSAGAPSLPVTGSPTTGIFSAAADQISLAIKGVEELRIDQYGRLSGFGLHNNAQLPSGTSVPFIASGTWSCTFQNGVNTTSLANPESGQWIRVGNVLTASIWITFSPTAASTSTQFQFSLPMSVSTGNAGRLVGVAAITNAVSSAAGQVDFTSANWGRVFYFSAANTNSVNCSVHFTMQCG